MVSCGVRLGAYLDTLGMFQCQQDNLTHIWNIRNNDPQLAYAQHILRKQHEYGTLLKPIHKTTMLIPYEQLFIQTFHHNGNLITEQSRGEQNPLFPLVIDTSLKSQPFHNR